MLDLLEFDQARGGSSDRNRDLIIFPVTEITFQNLESQDQYPSASAK